MENNNQVLEIRSLTSGYRGRSVLHNVSLSVGSNEHVALIGTNGCGKSTLLRTLMNLVHIDSGEVIYLGNEITRKTPESISANGIGYLKQTGNVFCQMSIRDNLQLAADRSYGDSARRERVLEYFPAIRSRLNTRAGLLSGGQRQALAFAMVLIRPIKLLLLDEPIAGLSPAASLELLQSLKDLRVAYPFASIVVEHRLKRIQPFVSRVVVMREGQIVDDTADTSRMLDADWLDQHYRSTLAFPPVRIPTT